MNGQSIAEQLDRDIEELLSNSGTRTQTAELRPLLAIAAAIQLLPSPEFRDRLQTDLLQKVEGTRDASGFRVPPDDLSGETGLQEPSRRIQTETYAALSFPTLVHKEWSLLPADPRSVLISFTSHAALVVLIVSGIWVGRGTIVKSTPPTSNFAYVPMPVGEDTPHGGGTGGDQSAIRESRGTPPKFSEQQLAPPVIVVHVPRAKLQVNSTVLGPPQLNLPESNRIGELLSPNAMIPSNGTGSGGGIGSNHGTGIGSGFGGGVGTGSGAGCCSGIYVPGKGVSAPHALYDPEPDYSEEARKVRLQGVVVLSLIVDPSGHPRNVQIARSLGMGLDEKALEAVQKWRFAPGMKDGYPVATKVEVEVNFHLY